jgi:RNA polymerase sigma-70 factor (ECF subfamily)
MPTIPLDERPVQMTPRRVDEVASSGLTGCGLVDEHDDCDDGLLVVDLHRRCSRAIDALYARHQPTCYALAVRVTRDRHFAEDVVQETFVTLWRAPETYDAARGSLLRWLLTISHRRSVDRVRREDGLRAHPVVDLLVGEQDAQPAVADQVADLLGAEAVRRALRGLDDRLREPLLLAYYGGYSQPQIAAITGIPLGTVKTRTRYGLRRLRAVMSSLGEVA